MSLGSCTSRSAATNRLPSVSTASRPPALAGVVGGELIGELDLIDDGVDPLLVGGQHDEVAGLVEGVGDALGLEPAVELGAPVGVPVGEVVDDLLGVLVEEGVVDVGGRPRPLGGAVEEPVDLVLVVGGDDERGALPGVDDAGVGEHPVDARSARSASRSSYS